MSVTATADVEPADHIVRVEVRDPTGSLCLPCSRNIATKAGRAQVTLRLALNERAGRWTLNVRDTVSGKTAEAPFTIVGRPPQAP